MRQEEAGNRFFSLCDNKSGLFRHQKKAYVAGACLVTGSDGKDRRSERQPSTPIAEGLERTLGHVFLICAQ